jgi:hypothetical protein
MVAIDDDPLIVETHDAIDDELHDSSRFPSNGAHSLKNTTHLKALSTALRMARSHHAVAVEAATAAEESADSDRFRTALNHHLRALQLICETQRLRAASNKSTGENLRFMGAAKRVIAASRVLSGGRVLATRAHDLSTVSYASRNDM